MNIKRWVLLSAILVSCQQSSEEKIESGTTENVHQSEEDNSLEDLPSGDRQPISLPSGIPTSLTASYYNNSFGGGLNAANDEAVAGTTVKYLSLNAGDIPITWTVTDITAGAHGIFEVNGTSGENDQLVVQTGNTLSYASAPFLSKGLDGGLAFYCTADACGGTCYTSQNSTKVYDSGTMSCDDAVHAYYTHIAYEDVQNEGSVSSSWLEIIDNAAPVIGNMDGDSVGFDGSLVDVVNLDDGANATITDTESISYAGGDVKIRFVIRNCETSEDSITFDNDSDSDAATGWHLSSGTISHDGTAYGTYTENTSSPSGFWGSNICYTNVIFNASASDSLVETMLREVQFKNEETIPEPGTRTVTGYLYESDGSTSKLLKL